MATIITMPKFDFQEYKYSQLEKEEEMYFWDRKVCSFFPQLNFCILTKKQSKAKANNNNNNNNIKYPQFI
ncbi:hypothetical protein U3516DRAFT_742487 [Neocallimastix sp. 'constans']